MGAAVGQVQTETVALAGCAAPVTWRRSKRARRITLRIDPQAGGVVVTLPMRTAQAAGRALLVRNADWVAEKLAALPAPVTLGAGAELMLEGRMLAVRHVPGGRGGAWLEGDALCVAGEAGFVARRAADFLRDEAWRRLSARAREKAAAAGLRIARVSVKDTRSRWGSCSSKGALMFCWRLVMAPGFVQDYVVAHEVAHLRHLNHGAAFWALTDRLSPHRVAAVAWLQREGPGLLRVG